MYWILVTVINYIMSMHAKKRRWFKTQSLNNIYHKQEENMHSNMTPQHINRTNNFDSKLTKKKEIKSV